MQITVSEWKIIDLLWKKPMTIMQLTKELHDETQWTKYTIIVLLKRMLEKNTVRYTMEGRTKLFYPNVKREDAEIEESEDLLNKVFDGKISLMVSALANKNKISDEEIDALCKMLNLERSKK
ncbi:MAG: BlaI/MecI/CopY family transcriptional regulator [Lachnospiraceae bacterium]|jgi:BlaI family penicillinase repressor|nr:BlaI/MecI/CopY family transcriptional regulator [Lachnospiraceae bacterium]